MSRAKAQTTHVMDVLDAIAQHFHLFATSNIGTDERYRTQLSTLAKILFPKDELPSDVLYNYLKKVKPGLWGNLKRVTQSQSSKDNTFKNNDAFTNLLRELQQFLSANGTLQLPNPDLLLQPDARPGTFQHLFTTHFSSDALFYQINELCKYVNGRSIETKVHRKNGTALPSNNSQTFYHRNFEEKISLAKTDKHYHTRFDFLASFLVALDNSLHARGTDASGWHEQTHGRLSDETIEAAGFTANSIHKLIGDPLQRFARLLRVMGVLDRHADLLSLEKIGRCQDLLAGEEQHSIFATFLKDYTLTYPIPRVLGVSGKDDPELTARLSDRSSSSSSRSRSSSADIGDALHAALRQEQAIEGAGAVPLQMLKAPKRANRPWMVEREQALLDEFYKLRAFHKEISWELTDAQDDRGDLLPYPSDPREWGAELTMCRAWRLKATPTLAQGLWKKPAKGFENYDDRLRKLPSRQQAPEMDEERDNEVLMKAL